MNDQKFVLRYVSKGEHMEILFSDRMLLIGASKDNDIILQDCTIPDCAAKIEMINSAYHMEPIGKTDLLINGKKIKRPVQLNVWDRIEISSYLFIFDCMSNKNKSSVNPETELLLKVNKIIESIGKERSLPVLLNKLMSILIEITGGTEVFIFKLDHDKKPSIFVTTCKGSSEEWFSDTIIQTVLQNGKGLCIPNALSDPSYKNVHSIADLKLQSVICSPITIAGKILGLIYVGCRKAAKSFTDRDLELLNLYATITAMLINHVEFMSQQNDILSKLTNSQDTDGIIANSKEMRDLLTTISSIAQSDISILLEGETGTGKSSIAQLIHQKSHRSKNPFIVVNCSSLRGELLESELFGHKKGSFTGAISDHDGLFKAAQGGTIFLDEIGELELSLQAKLLRTLETGKIRPIGSTQEFSVDTRVICATNRNLAKMISDDTFRTDLYYRINQFSIVIPPLRDRGEDIILLSYFFLEKYKIQYSNRDIFDFHPDTLRYIQNHNWPGNIRELSNAIHRAILTSRSPLIQLHIDNDKEQKIVDFEYATKIFQKDLIQRTIEIAGGNKEEAAKQLGLSRSTFYRYQSQLGL